MQVITNQAGETIITIQAGETINQRVPIKLSPGVTLGPQDVILMVIRRSATGDVLWHCVCEPQEDDVGPYFIWTMTHKETEALGLGSCSYGIGLYVNSIMVDGIPVDGSIVKYTDNGTITVTNPSGREEGIHGRVH